MAAWLVRPPVPAKDLDARGGRAGSNGCRSKEPPRKEARRETSTLPQYGENWRLRPGEPHNGMLKRGLCRDLAMIRITASHGLLAGLALVMAACATPGPPLRLSTGTVLLRWPPCRYCGMTGHSQSGSSAPLYVDYLDEPTRFEFLGRASYRRDTGQRHGRNGRGGGDDGSYLETAFSM